MNNGDWWCPECKEALPWQRVTYAERCDTCGTPVCIAGCGHEAELARLNAILGVYRRLGFYAPGESADTVLDHMQRIAKSNLELLDKKDTEIARLTAERDALLAVAEAAKWLIGEPNACAGGAINWIGSAPQELRDAISAWEKHHEPR